MPKCALVTNFPPGDIVDGGTHRGEALARFLTSQGAARFTVQDDGFRRDKAGKVHRLTRLLGEITEAQPELVVLSYPSYPFYWQHKVTPYFLMSLAFAAMLRREADRRGFRVVVDIMDLPAFQFADLGFSLEMRPATLQRFDRFIFSHADTLWVCSESIARMVRENYGIDDSRIVVALNGHQMHCRPVDKPDPPATLKFAYAGSLNRERGIASTIEAFLKGGGPDTELHLCGPYGEWIAGEYSDPRIVHHGALTDEQAGDTLANCDIGLVPYPERGYYHVAFATKLPFYLALGMPVLCSNARESSHHVNRLGVGLCWPMDDFGSAFAYLSRSRGQVRDWREQVLRVRSELSWSSIYSRAVDATLERSAARRERAAA